MEKAKIVVMEDNEDQRLFLRNILKKNGHSVVAEAVNRAAALALLDEINQGELECDAIILDGNLTKGAVDCRDAQDVNDKRKELGIRIPLIGFSHLSLSELGIVTPDFDTKKDREKVISIIKNQL